MHLIWKRYAKSGYAPGWFYIIAAIAFVVVAIWGAVELDWIVAFVAIAMACTAIAGGRLMRRLSDGLAESSRRVHAQSDGADATTKNDDGGST